MPKTKPSHESVKALPIAIAHPKRRADALALDALFRRVTGFTPKLWGPGMVGYGRYHYEYATGQKGENLATGFSPRKTDLVLYILPGYTDFGDILARMGKTKSANPVFTSTSWPLWT